MPRDYKPKLRSRSSKRSRSGGLAWLVAGLLLGLAAAFTAYLMLPRGGVQPMLAVPGPASTSPGLPTPEPTASRPELPVSQEPAPKPRFEFYQILPEMEVPVPEQAPGARPAKPAVPDPRGNYLVQVGSFRNMADADRLKAQLALLGMRAHIQTVAVDANTTWYRVRLGPYPAVGAANDVRTRLREHAIEAIVLKVNT